MNILMITDNDPAGMAIAFTNAINRYTEHTCRLIVTQERYGFDYETDIYLPDIENDDFGEIDSLLRQADIIHFHIMRDENSHLGPLVIRDYIKGKKILHHHHGHPDYLINADAFNAKYRRLNRRVIVSTPDLLHVAENATWVPNLVPIYNVRFMPRYEESIPGDELVVCQSPTRKFHKHTGDFKAVMQGLQQKYPHLRSLVIEKTPYNRCLQMKRNCHMVFDHMRGWFGIASLESLSHGKPVIAGLDEWNIKCIKEFTGAEDLPWIIARSRDDLYKQIEELVVDKERRIECGKASRAFMEDHWTEQHALKILIDVYETL